MIIRNKIPTWEQLRTIGSSAPSRVLVFAPFISYILILNEYSLSLAKEVFRSALIGIDAAIVPTFSLYCIYFGSVIFGLGSLLYIVYCPSQIKKYGDVITYLDKEINFLIDDDISVQTDYILNSVVDHTSFIAPKDNASILKTYYYTLNESHKYVRIVVSILFFSGIFLLSLPSILTFVKIVRMFVP